MSDRFKTAIQRVGAAAATLAKWTVQSSRGSATSPTVVQDDDVVWEVEITAHDGTDYVALGYMRFVVDDTPATNDMPGKFQIWLSPNGSATPVKVFEIPMDGITALNALSVAGDINCQNVKSGSNALAADRFVEINTAAGQVRDLRFLTGGVQRWTLRVTNTAESGSNAGSDLQIIARADDGSGIDVPITITRGANGTFLTVRPFTCSHSSGITAGVAGATRGRVRAARGTSTNTPGVFEYQALDGTVWYTWFTAAGQMRRHTSLPTSDSDGSAV